MPPTPSPLSSPPSSDQGQAESLYLLHTLIISLITTIGGYVLFQFQSKELSLFDEHGNIMKTIFVMLFLYALGLMAEFRLLNQTTYIRIIKRFTPLIGLLVVVLLLLILSPVVGLAAFVIWALLVVKPTVRSFQEIVQWLRGIILHFRSMVPHFRSSSHSATSNLDMQEESDSPGVRQNNLPI